MRFSPTFSFYIVKKLLINLLYVFSIFCCISFIIELLEFIRKIQGQELLFTQMLKIVFYKIPFLSLEFLPFIFLFGGILTFTKLNNNSEFTAAKAAGISIWSICLPIGVSVGIIAILNICAFQPISAVFLNQNHILESSYLGRSSHRVSFQKNGLWLYDQTINPEDEKIINLKYIKNKEQALSEITVYYAGKDHSFTTRLLAKSALIEDGKLVMNEVTKYLPESAPIKYDQLTLVTSILPHQIQESIPNPDIIPLWNLPDFIKQMKQSGFSTLKHELYYNAMLTSPLLYISLVLISLVCSLTLPRKDRAGIAFVIGGLIGILIFFINRMVTVMVLTGSLPITLAALAPGIAYLLVSLALLIHYEEG